MNRKKILLEKSLVVVLFVSVMVVFSLAERDSKKLVELYTKKATAKTKTEVKPAYTAALKLKSPTSGN